MCKKCCIFARFFADTMTNISTNHPLFPILKTRVEQQLGHALTSPQAIRLLNNALEHQLNEDTIRRLWNIRGDGYKSVRRFTLDILCRYIGLKDWEDFVAYESKANGRESESVSDRLRLPLDTWQAGAALEVTWLPDRKMKLEYLGGYEWRIVSVENSTTLREGDTFACRTIAQEQSMYMESLTRDGKQMSDYKIGTQHGIHYAC